MTKDKYLHFGACAFVSVAITVVLILIGTSWFAALLGGFYAGMAAGLGKEYGDKVNPTNRWDWQDVLADLVGSVAGSVIGLLALLI